MYGLVNRAVQELLTTRFGQETWETIAAEAGVQGTSFVSMTPYPDEITYKLVGAASKTLNIPAAVVLETFGEFWTDWAARNGHATLVKMGGTNLVEFLDNLDNLHTRLAMMFPKLRPPSFRSFDVTPTSLRVVYISERDGLAPFVTGLLRGLGVLFGTPVEVVLESSPPEERRSEGHVFFVRYAAALPATAPHTAAIPATA